MQNTKSLYIGVVSACAGLRNQRTTKAEADSEKESLAFCVVVEKEELPEAISN